MLLYDVAYLTGTSVKDLLDMPTEEFVHWIAYLQKYAGKHSKF